MKRSKYIFILWCFSSTLFSQSAFKNIDTLLTRNFESVNLKNEMTYLTLINKEAVFKGKTAKTKADSSAVLKPFSDAFEDMVKELTDFAGINEIEVKYENYEPLNTNYYNSKVTGKIIVNVNLVINNTFTVKAPFAIMADKGTYTIEHPMMVMFAE